LFGYRNAATVAVVKTTFLRARQPAQKAQRRAHLLATARATLAEGVALRELGLNELARRAGMAKANVYTYFESREALLLALLSDEWERWFTRLQAASTPPGRALALDEVVALLAGSLARAPLLCELTAALPTVLEQNLSESAIRAFKREVLVLFAQVAAHLAHLSPTLPASTYAELIYDAAQAMVALFPITHPAPAAARALADPELRFFRRDFETELARVLRALAVDHARRAAPR
jgi:AcrR family transcriptional regulator